MDAKESAQYHSLPQSLCTDRCEEAAILLKLPPHPNVVSLLNHQQRSTDSFAVHIRDLDLEDRSTAYRMAPTAHLLFFTPYKKTLADYFIEQKQQNPQSPFGVCEEEILSILSQMLLGVVHLENHHVAHCAITPESIAVGDDRKGLMLMLTDFSNAVDLRPQELDSQMAKLSRLAVNNAQSLAPEVLQKLSSLQETKDIASCDFSIADDLEDLFKGNDVYSVGRVIYGLLSEDRLEGESFSTPYLNRFSPQCNHILSRLVCYNRKDRMAALDAAMCCMLLLYGPESSTVHSVEDCHRWMLSECIEFYMRPVLKGLAEDYTSVQSKLQYTYLTVADPEKIWKAHQFLNGV